MKTNEFLNLIRKVVRDEVRTVLREELADINKSQIIENKSVKNLVKDIPVRKEIKSTGNPIADLLQETAAEGSWRTLLNATSPMAPNFSSMMPNISSHQTQTTTVEGFLKSATPSNDVSQVQLGDVPDYTAIMGKLKEKGKI